MSDPGGVELTLEQQFNLRSFESQVAQMSREQAQQFLVKLYQDPSQCSAYTAKRLGGGEAAHDRRE